MARQATLYLVLVLSGHLHKKDFPLKYIFYITAKRKISRNSSPISKKSFHHHYNVTVFFSCFPHVAIYFIKKYINWCRVELIKGSAAIIPDTKFPAGIIGDLQELFPVCYWPLDEILGKLFGIYGSLGHHWNNLVQ